MRWGAATFPSLKEPLCNVRFGSLEDIGPSTHVAFWLSLIQELPARSASAFLEARMSSADKINFVKMIVCPLRSAAKSPVVQEETL